VKQTASLSGLQIETITIPNASVIVTDLVINCNLVLIRVHVSCWKSGYSIYLRL